MPKRTKICFNVCQIVWNKKNRPRKISPNLGHNRGEGRPRWKVVTLSSVFFNPSLTVSCAYQSEVAMSGGPEGWKGGVAELDGGDMVTPRQQLLSHRLQLSTVL